MASLLPFRFKAGGTTNGAMGPISSAGSHHHRSTTKSSQKPFKSRHLSKSALKDIAKGKVEKGVRKTPHQQMKSKLDRKNQAKQRRLTKDAQLARTNSVFTGREGAPRIVAVLDLIGNGGAEKAVGKLNESIDFEGGLSESGVVRVGVERFKQSILYMCVKRRLLDVLDACRVADFVVLVLSVTEEVDEFGEELLRAIGDQGISNVVAVAEVFAELIHLLEHVTNNTRALIASSPLRSGPQYSSH